MGPDVTPVADKLGNLSIIGDSQQGDIGDSAPPDMTDVVEVERVESDDDDERRVIIKSHGLAPFSRLHDNYKSPNYHPSIEVRKRANRNITKIFKLFAYLLRNNGLRNVECYLIIMR